MDQKYFIIDGTEKLGPFTIQQLKELHIKRTDLVWHGGLINWTEAEKIDELKSLFSYTPPIILEKNLPAQIPQNYSTQKIGNVEYLSDNTIKVHYQNEIIHYRFANFGERLGARILDVLIIIVPTIIIPILPWLYFSLMHCSTDQQTLGQKAANIKLLSTDGTKVTFGQSTGRYFANFLNSLTLFIGFFMFFFNPKNQCLHDILAGTLVVSEIGRVRR